MSKNKMSLLLYNLLGKKPKGFGLEIEDRSLKAFMIEKKRKGKCRVLSCGMKNLKKGIMQDGQVFDTEALASEIKELLESKPVEVTLERGQMIEITSGPFKGEKAKIVRIDQDKEEVTVELVEVAVPIPVTIKLDTIRVLPQSRS